MFIVTIMMYVFLKYAFVNVFFFFFLKLPTPTIFPPPPLPPPPPEVLGPNFFKPFAEEMKETLRKAIYRNFCDFGAK